MRNDDDRHLGRQLGHQILDLRDGGRVDGGAGLVHQQDIGLHRKHARDAQTLLLTTRERQTILVELIGYLFPEVGALERFFHDVIEVAFASHALQTRAKGDILVDGFRERVGLLKDHTHATTEVDRVDALGIDIVAVERHGALDARTLDQVIHAIDAAQKRRLSATRRANKSSNGILSDIEVEPRQRMKVTVPEVEILGRDGRLLRRGSGLIDGHGTP